MNEEQIKKVMRRADEIADYAWKEGVSDGAYSNAKQDRECRAESRTELEAYLRTIGKPESVDTELLEALKRASATLEAIGDLPSMKADMDAAIARAESAVETSAKVSPCAGHAAQLPDPLGLLSCTHPDCGRYEGPRSHECRAMADNACARPSICQGHAAQQEAAESCGHRFVRDEEAPRHLCCQVCGEVKNEADEAHSCETCGGRGEVGGFVGGGAPGYETHPCPDCRADEAGGA